MLWVLIAISRLAVEMSKLNETDIQGFVLRGYNLPVARYFFLHFENAKRTTQPNRSPAQPCHYWPAMGRGKTPEHGEHRIYSPGGTVHLQLPDATLLSFPVEFQQGMKHRAEILGDSGVNSPDRWDGARLQKCVHAWLGINGLTPEGNEHPLLGYHYRDRGDRRSFRARLSGSRCGGHQRQTDYQRTFSAIQTASVIPTTSVSNAVPSRDRASFYPTEAGHSPATGRLLLGYADEAGRYPVAPVPHLLASNGTFMVYRKLPQNLGTFRDFLGEQQARVYGGGKEQLTACKFVGRWRDGTPIELSPNIPDPHYYPGSPRALTVTFGADAEETRCAL